MSGADKTTSFAHTWGITRADGMQLGFTDHDYDLRFAGFHFRADTGFSGFAVQQSLGLSGDNTEALGVLRDDAINEQDLRAGRFDGAQINIWRVNWQNLDENTVIFSGTIGKISHSGASFRAQILGLADQLARPIGRLYQKSCQAVLGDETCRVAMDDARFHARISLTAALDTDCLILPAENLQSYPPAWFAHGRVLVETGAARGVSLSIKSDEIKDGFRKIALWSALPVPAAAGDQIALFAGCDKRAETCRVKFNNMLNYQGFPHLPDEGLLVKNPNPLAIESA